MSEPNPDFERLLDFIRDERAFDFTGYKRASLERRITKRMHERGLDSYPDYEALLRSEPDEFAVLFDTIMINVTSFFRDDQAWDFVASHVVPTILERNDGDVRIWSTGCASGEEAFTVAMVLAEALGEDAFRRRAKIYATDIDEAALTEGRHARYTRKHVEPVPEALRERYLEESNGGYVFRQDLRRNVIFGRHDLIQDPPISRIDLLLSRNTLMYFTTETQERILRNFHFSLRDGGFLFLGKSEALAARSTLFSPVDLKRRVFAKSTRERRQVVALPEQARRSSAPRQLDEVVREAALDAAPVAEVVVDPDGTVVLANAHARALFGLTHQDLGRPIQDLPLSYRPVELRSRIEEAQAERHAVWVRDVEWANDHEARTFDVQVAPLFAATGEVAGTAITFTDVTRFNRLRDEANVSKRQLETAYEELQSAVEELETTNEELQSTNEELETTNEELQSTNEELETMNEELQSTNEELEAMNDELQQRTDEVNDTNAFLESILGGVRAAVVVVDGDLRVDAWNDAARDLWGLRADEALGQHLLNLDIGLPVDGLRPAIRQVLTSEQAVEATLRGVDRRGRSVEYQVELGPLDGSGGIRGVIVMAHAHEVGAT